MTLRTIRRAVATAALLALAVASSAAAAERPALPSAKDRWFELESEHFAFHASASEKTVRRLATRLERLRQVLAKLSGEATLATSRPTEIFVFENERAFEPYQPLGPDGRPRDLGGYFLARADQNSIAIYDWDGGDPIAPVLHEYLHSLADVNFGAIPVWVNEGIADFYSTFQITELEAEIGRPVRDYVQILDGARRMPSERLFAVGPDDPEYNESARRTIFYAQSWLTTHFLLLGRPERKGDFGRYLAKLEAGGDPAAAFQESFGLAPAALEKELDLYLRKRVFPFVTFQFADLPPVAGFRVREVAYPETLARLGDLQRRLGPAERERGLVLIEEARRLDPKSAIAALALGQARLAEGRPDEAEKLFREALALDPELEPAQAALGSLLAFGTPGRLPDAEKAAESRALLDRSTARQPGRLESWIALSRVELVEGGDRKRAIRAAENAWRLAPRRTDLLGFYAMALAEDGQFTRAAALVRGELATSRRAEDRASAEHYLRQMAEREIVTLANAGRSEEALARIEALLAETSDPALTENLLAWKAQIEGNAQADRCVDDFNAGIRTANEQKFAEAIPFFEKVIAACADDPALVERARTTLAEIQTFVKKKKR